MESQEIKNILIKLHNENETKWLETMKAVLDYYREALDGKYKDFIYEEYNRLTKRIAESGENIL